MLDTATFNWLPSYSFQSISHVCFPFQRRGVRRKRGAGFTLVTGLHILGSLELSWEGMEEMVSTSLQLWQPPE